MGDSINFQEANDLYWEDYSADRYMDQYDSGYDCLSVEGERERIENLLGSSSDLSTDAKQKLEDLERSLLGRSPDLEEIDKAIDELDPTIPERKKGPESLDSQLEDYLSEQEKNLSKDEKEQINKWIASYELDPDGTKKLITKEFNDLKSSIGTEEVYGSKIEQLADATGMKPAAIEEVFQKHGITDSQDLSDKEIQLVLPDLAGKELEQAQQKLQTATESLQSAWDQASRQAEKVNATNRTNEEDATSNDFNSFKKLSDIANHRAPEALAYQDALRGVAQASAPILAALKGVPEAKVQVLSGSPSTGDAKADQQQTYDGMLQIDGEKYNVIGNPRTGETIISDQLNPWPSMKTNASPIFRNEYTNLPSWVNRDDYPVEGFHGGGGGFGFSDMVPFLFF